MDLVFECLNIEFEWVLSEVAKSISIDTQRARAYTHDYLSTRVAHVTLPHLKFGRSGLDSTQIQTKFNLFHTQ